MALGVPEILDVLDRSAALDWPDFWGITMTEYHALWLIAVRSRTGDDWGIVFDSIRGSILDEALALGAGVWSKVYGSRVEVGLHNVPTRWQLPLVVPEDRDQRSLHLEGLDIEGPAGRLRCADEMIARLDLRPGRVCNL